MVSNNAGLTYNVPMQAGVPVQMQGVDPEKLKQQVDNSYLANRAKASEETNPAAMLGVGSAVWYGVAQGMDKFNPKCGGTYNQSLLGKLGKFGDEISTKTFLGRKFEGFMRWMDKGLDKLSNKSKIVYTLRNHSTKPEWSFAKTPGAGLHGFLAMDTEQVFEDFLKPIAQHPAPDIMGIPLGKKYNAFRKLEQYGMSSDSIKAFVDSLKGKDFAAQSLALQRKELELLGVGQKIIDKVETKTGLEGLQKLARNFKVRKLGFNSMREYEALKGKFLDNPDEVMKVLEKGYQNTKHMNGGQGLKISIWRGKNKLKNHLFGRTVSISEYLNKYKATLGKGNKTTLGKFLPKALGWIVEGGTNRFAGGKLAVAMQAGIFADMLINTFKAPKGEKGKTFIERLVNDFSYFLALTVGIVGMHKVGGFKYAGTTVAGREAYRKALNTFNANVDAGLYTGNKAGYKAASKAVDSLLETKNIKNPITKLLQKIGKFINIGNERKHSYKSANKLNLNWLRKLANGNILGVPMRIVIPMMIVSPFIAKWATKAVHAVFGRPTKSVLDEEPEEPTPEQLQQQQLEKLIAEAQRQAQLKAQQNKEPFVSNNSPTNLLNPYRQNQPVQQPQPFVSNNSPSNLLTMYKNGNPYRNTITKTTTTTNEQQNATNTTNNINNQTNTTVNNVQNGETAKQPEEPVRTYIPSPDPVVLTNNNDMSAVDRALKRADLAEKSALETLAIKG